jgi:hypothetical protein
MNSIASIIGYILLFGSFMAVLLVAAPIVVSQLPPDNPLRRMLASLCARICLTLGAGIVGLPLQAIPGIDAVYDVAAICGLLYVWCTLIREVMAVLADVRQPSPAYVEENAPLALAKVKFTVRQISERADKETVRLPL